MYCVVKFVIWTFELINCNLKEIQSSDDYFGVVRNVNSVGGVEGDPGEVGADRPLWLSRAMNLQISP